MQYPKRRTDVEAESLGERLTIHDLAQGDSYVLNAPAALVWQHCDGQTSAPRVIELLRQRFRVSEVQAEQQLALALGELDRARLLETPGVRPLPSRRQMLQAAMIAGLAVVLAPMVARATCRIIVTTTAAPTTTFRPPTTTPPPTTTTTE